MEITEELKEMALEKIYSIIDDLIDEFASERVRIKFKKDIMKRFYQRLNKSEREKLHLLSERLIYELVKSIEVLEKDPERSREFITYKSRWRKFRERELK